MTKIKKKSSDASEVYLKAVNRNVELIAENRSLTEEITRLRSSVANPYHITLKMYTDHDMKVWDFSPILKTIQFEGPALLVKILRTIHHQYAILNIQEQVTALNRHTLSINDYSEQIPNELYILKTLADNIEAIRCITDV